MRKTCCEVCVGVNERERVEDYKKRGWTCGVPLKRSVGGSMSVISSGIRDACRECDLVARNEMRVTRDASKIENVEG